MKRFQFICITLAIAMVMVLISICALAGSILYLKLMTTQSNDPVFYGFDYMVTPMYLLFLLTALALLLACCFGLYSAYLYRKDKIFDITMEVTLTKCSLSFLGASLATLLLDVYWILNAQIVLVGVLFLLTAFLFLVASLILFLLADVVGAGRLLREEQALTI